MANRTSPLHEASRLHAWQLLELGREIRVARVTAGRRQRDVARMVRTSVPRVSLIERGRVRTISVHQLSLVAAAVGLKLSLRAFPAMRRLLDQPQLELLEALRQRAHPSWRWETEVPMPIPGDLRAADARARIPGCSIVIELWSRLADVQAQTRAALLKSFRPGDLRWLPGWISADAATPGLTRTDSEPPPTLGPPAHTSQLPVPISNGDRP